MTNQDVQVKEPVREPEAPKVKHYQLTTRAQVNGAIQEPGFRFTLPEGVLGPHKTVVASSHGANVVGHSGALVDVPLYIELDEAIEAEREEMRVRHAEQLAELDGTADRAALIAKQQEESRALGIRAAESEVARRHEQELIDLKDRQAAEEETFDEREKNEPVLTVATPETDKAALEARHKAEADALAKKQEGEQAAIDARKETAVKPQEPKFAPSVADKGFVAKPAAEKV